MILLINLFENVFKWAPILILQLINHNNKSVLSDKGLIFFFFCRGGGGRINYKFRPGTFTFASNIPSKFRKYPIRS